MCISERNTHGQANIWELINPYFLCQGEVRPKTIRKHASGTHVKIMAVPEHPICRASVHTNRWNARCSSRRARRARRARRGWHFDTPNIHWGAVSVTWVDITLGWITNWPGHSKCSSPISALRSPCHPKAKTRRRFQWAPHSGPRDSQGIWHHHGNWSCCPQILRGSLTSAFWWSKISSGRKGARWDATKLKNSTMFFRRCLEQTDILVAQTTDHPCEVIKSGATKALKKLRWNKIPWGLQRNFQVCQVNRTQQLGLRGCNRGFMTVLDGGASHHRVKSSAWNAFCQDPYLPIWSRPLGHHQVLSGHQTWLGKYFSVKTKSSPDQTPKFEIRMILSHMIFPFKRQFSIAGLLTMLKIAAPLQLLSGAYSTIQLGGLTILKHTHVSHVLNQNYLSIRKTLPCHQSRHRPAAVKNSPSLMPFNIFRKPATIRCASSKPPSTADHFESSQN